MCIYHILFIQSSVARHLAWFYLSAIVNNVAMNIGVQISVQIPAFNPFKYIPRNGIVGSCNSIYNLLRSHHIIFFAAAVPFCIPTSKARSHHCETVFIVATIIISKYYIKINVEQEIRMTIFNLTPRSESPAYVPFVSSCGYLRIKYNFFSFN